MTLSEQFAYDIATIILDKLRTLDSTHRISNRIYQFQTYFSVTLESRDNYVFFTIPCNNNDASVYTIALSGRAPPINYNMGDPNVIDDIVNKIMETLNV